MSATWRHWSHFTGSYESTQPSGKLVELYGTIVATLNKVGLANIFLLFLYLQV